MVVTGETDGLDEVELNPDGVLAQAYVLPATAVAPMDTDAPLQILVLDATAAAGKAYIVTVTGFDLVQPVAVIVSVRV